jgi:anti-anti-sigma factor
MARPFSWTPSAQERGAIELHGAITEHADLDALAVALHGTAVLHLGDVDYINSIGVRTWIRFVRRCEAEGVQLTLVAVSPVMVAQMNMIAGFSGPATVRSVAAPFVCPACQIATTTVLDLSDDLQAAFSKAVVCTCGTTMEFDDLPEQYLAFRSSG